MNEPEPSTQPDGNRPREDLRHTLQLAMVSGVGPKTRRSLLERFGTSEAVLQAAPSQLREVQGVGPKLTGKILAARDTIDPEQLIADCQAHGVTILTDADDAYPVLLKQIYDPPAVLFVRGQFRPQDGMAVAIVGTRHGTPYGMRQAERLGSALALAGLTIVSGLARGIDSAAHRGALAAGGRTIAVLGSGVLNIYPPEHDRLAESVTASGAVISEAPPHASPQSGVFPQRNRIISGLSLGVIVVEAADRSGALITARLAMEQNREVFAVPGHVDDRTSHGCHRLIRDGAKLVQCPEDVLEEFGPLFTATTTAEGRTVHHPAELLLNELEQRVLDAVGTEATLVDGVVTATGLSVPQVLATLSVLEMRRLIRRVSGTTVVRL
jgi:DNA processing protein